MDLHNTIHILLVEDNPTDVLLAEEALTARSFNIQSIPRLGDALRFLLAQHFDVILLDLGLPDSQGLDTLRTLRSKNSQVAIVVLTGKDDEELALQSLKEGAQDYLVKSDLQEGSLQRAIRYALERSASAKMLRQSEDRLLELTENIDQVLWMIDAREAKVLYVSPGYEEMWGRSCQSLIDNPHSYLDGIHPLDLEMMRREENTMYRTGFLDAECRIVRPDRSVRWVWFRGYPVKERDRIIRLVGVIEDITEKKNLAAERDALLSRLQLHIQRMPLAYILFDSDLCIIDWNPTAEIIFGYSRHEVIGKQPPYADFVPPSNWEEQDNILNRIRSGDMNAHWITENRTRQGQTITCQWFNTPLMAENGTFLGYLSLALDVTERKVLEEKLRQSQKMEAIGILAGGIAHDFNNLLTIILCYSGIIQSEVPTDSPIQELVHEISQAGERAASLTRQLLAFSRKQVLDVKVLSLNNIVTETERMLRRLIGEDLALTTVLDPAIGKVRADANQIEQVILNLAVNARDAMPQGGKLTIETANVELDDTYTQAYPDLKPGLYAMLAVTDTGTGLDHATQARIFEPFFTTKGMGRGTGLGLATVFGIVKQSQGHIAVYSELGMGTTFKVYLPIIEEIAQPDVFVQAPSTAVFGTETILLTEDEPALRVLARHVLETRGYTILEAGTGEQALRIAEEHKDAIHLLVTDVVLPGMSGRLLADRITKTRPGLKVLYLSGYTDDAVTRHGILESETAFLQKPFTPVGLAQKVRGVLDQL